MRSSLVRNVLLIARREYLQHVRTKAFLIGTFLTPLLMIGLMVGPAKLMMRSTGAKSIVLVASSQQTGESVKAQIENGMTSRRRSDSLRGTSTPTPTTTVTVTTDATEATRAELSRQVDEKKIDGFVWATDDALENRQVSFYTRENTDFMFSGMLQDAITMGVLKGKLQQRGMSGEEVEQMMRTVRLDTVRLEGGKTSRTNMASVFLGAITMMMVLYFMVLMQGITVMRAVLEEKSSRVMEVLLSTCSATELMAGKILGVGALGLTQIAIWIALGAAMAAPGIVAASSMMENLKLSPVVIAFFAVFYVLGFLVYSAIYAALGASCNSEQEAQSLQFLAMLPLILSTALMMLVLRQPNSPLSVFFSMFPLTSPLIMFLRVVVQTPPWWQLALSVGFLLLGILVLMWISARIYRIGILMYGKRPTLPEILRWLRYA